MPSPTFYQNVHGGEEFYVDFGDLQNGGCKSSKRHANHNIPVLGSTVSKTKRWIGELMNELGWEEAPKAYHGLRAVLHALRDHLTIHEVADFSSQLPLLLRGVFYDGWQPDRVPVKDRSRQAFLNRISDAFPDDRSVDALQLTHAVLVVVRRHVSQGELADIASVLPKSLRDLLFPSQPS
jgi:uncharacterized protein (DUF2267 family)